MTRRFVPLLFLALVVTTTAAQQRGAPFRGLPWGPPPGPADPLEPWSLEQQPTVLPAPTPSSPPDVGLAVPTPGDSTSPRDARLDTPPDVGDLYGSDSTATDAIPVVRLRQILVENPHQARQLRELFDAGVPWAEARSLLKLGEVKEFQRQYALEDLALDLRAEVEALPDSAWSSGIAWRGRTMFFQVLSRALRSRSALPALGDGLSDQEKSRLAQLRPNLRQPQASGASNVPAEDEGLVQAAIVKQEPPIYPEAATIDGEVILVVSIGRQHDVTKVEVASSTDPIFEQPAIEAARRSEYRSATRNGIPEPGTIRLNYSFKVPTAPTSPESP
jgi:TonB family protein